MKPEDDFDAYLTRQLDETELPDNGFTHAVAARLKKHRRRRQSAFGAAVALAGLIAAFVFARSPAPALPMLPITSEALMATLLLVTVCSLVWIGTESRPPLRGES
jgi:hypothetical protein